jgi:hypothetical protein
MKKILFVIMALIISLSVAQNNPSSYYVDLSNPEDLVNPNNYYEYMIIKGDCLWFIADDFYGDPFKWTKIHEANPYIVHPDWIYPNNWLVIPKIFTDEAGNPIFKVVGETVVEETKRMVEPTPIDIDNDGTIDGYDLDGDGTIDESANIDLDGDGIVDGYDVDGDGQIDIEVKTTQMTETAETELVTTSDTTAETESMTTGTAKMTKEKGSCTESYCGKPGWSLGLHAGNPLGSAPEDETLNLGLLLGTPLSARIGPLQIGLGAGAFTYNFEDIYLGGGVLASLCINDVIKLESPLKLQLHGAGFYVFGEESGPGFGLIGSGSLPIGDSPINIGLYGGLGKYYPGENDYDWGNAGAVLFYKF